MDKIVISVTRRTRSSEKFLRVVMVVLAVAFLLGAVAGNRGMMLPCFLMAMAYFAYTHATRRQYEYILEDGRLRVDRLLERGRVTQHEFSLQDVEILARPKDEAVAPYRKGGGVKIRKFDYTSYDDEIPYYTMIAREDGKQIKLLLDLTEPAIERIRRENRAAVKL